MGKPSYKVEPTFYRKFLNTFEDTFQPTAYGIETDKERFLYMMYVYYRAIFGQIWTVEELLCRPKAASAFCDEVRQRSRYFDLPDHVILGSVLQLHLLGREGRKRRWPTLEA